MSGCFDVAPDLVAEARRQLRDSFTIDPQQMRLGILTAENTELHAILNRDDSALARVAFEYYLKSEKLKIVLRKILKDRIDVLDLCEDILEEL